MRVRDEGCSRNVPCALHCISTFLVHFKMFEIEMSLTYCFWKNVWHMLNILCKHFTLKLYADRSESCACIQWVSEWAIVI